jgi:muramoyltetrapeptide carboxypeptidase LdcA involved in peptidoglycan recycling
MIAGHFDGFGSGQGPDWGAVLADSLEGFDWPVAMGLESGHFPPNRTLPLGLPARLEEEGRRLVLGVPGP